MGIGSSKHELERFKEVLGFIKALESSQSTYDKGLSQELEEKVSSMLYELRHLIVILIRERLISNDAQKNNGLKNWSDIDKFLKEELK